MVIYNLDIVGIAVAPFETDAPLIVDANAVLPFPIAPKQLQAILGG
jgi:hypothetical protein